MTEQSISHSNLAALSLTTSENLGVLTAEINVQSSSDGWCQLLPAGKFKATDGRPCDVASGHWFIDQAIAEQVITQTAALKNDLLIDYEHQALLTRSNGMPVIAAGWFNNQELMWRESGLYIKPRWTAKAKSHIQAKEYCYLSAVFPYSRHTGAVQGLSMAALTNTPGLDCLDPVTALSASQIQIPEKKKEVSMPEWLKKLLQLLTIEVPADAAELSEEQGAVVLDAVQALKDKAEQPPEKKEDAALSVDLTQYVPKAVYDATVVELAALTQQSESQTVDQIVTAALSDGRAFAREKDYLTGFGKQQGVAALSAMLNERPAIKPLKQPQTQSVANVNKGAQSLSDEDVAVLSACGLDKAAYTKVKVES